MAMEFSSGIPQRHRTGNAIGGWLHESIARHEMFLVPGHGYGNHGFLRGLALQDRHIYADVILRIGSDSSYRGRSLLHGFLSFRRKSNDLT